MSVDNIDDIDMQHPHLELEPEDVQTSHDADLFDDNEDNDESDAGNFMDALSQLPPGTARLEKRARDEVASEKCRFHEVDYSQTLRQTVYEQQERINHIVHETELKLKTALRSNDVLQKKSTWQWEVALKEREQETHAQEARLRKNIAEEIARHEAEISARKNQELAEELAQREAEISARKDQELTEELARREEEISARKNQELTEELARREEEISARKNQELAEELARRKAELSARKDKDTEERQCLAEELARHEAELSRRKKQELEEHKKVIFAEMEQRLRLEIEKFRVEKESELANMEQRFARSGRQQHTAMETEMDTGPAPRSAQQQPKTPQKPQFKTLCLESIKKIRKARGATRKIRLVSVAEDNDPMETHRE
ncbi:hypothetical protein F4604DRAFT_1924802 [Suillus subluteus]|nr:hypothetical protein F4604DRAFT_1924802 [Suillus subluteus]